MQAAALRSMPDIVVATPGRMIDHLRNSISVDLDDLAVLILDEADRLLELGFSAEIRELVLGQRLFSPDSFFKMPFLKLSVPLHSLLFNVENCI